MCCIYYNVGVTVNLDEKFSSKNNKISNNENHQFGSSMSRSHEKKKSGTGTNSYAQPTNVTNKKLNISSESK